MKILTLILCLLLHQHIFAQAPRKLLQDPNYELKISEPSQVFVPESMNESKKYPLVIFLPFTGGTAQDFYDGYRYQAIEDGGKGYEYPDINFLSDSLKREPTEEEIASYSAAFETKQIPDRKKTFALFQKALFGDDALSKEFIILFPGGGGSESDHGWEGFEACIYRYENRILNDIDSLSQRYSIDQSKIILAGFSLGGDLSWAISQRYPEKFKGAIIAGSRCGYSEKGMMQRQAGKDVRYYIAMGENEYDVRLNGAKAAVTRLNSAGIKNKFVTIPEGDHVPATLEQFKEALDFILFK